LSVPFGVDGNGLPVGVQVMAPPLGEPVLFAVAGAIERAAGTTEGPT
jgi:aspartyl-tRNA(Asn)/glutamyl-tRNA(Gln) amidotransferase subunit A